MAEILVLDDSLEILEMLQMMLEINGHTVKTAPTTDLFKEALDKNLPNLFLIDVHLVNHNGREVCRNLKFYKRTKDIPIILISADPTTLVAFEECNADAVLEKPFSMHALLDTINWLVKSTPGSKLPVSD